MSWLTALYETYERNQSLMMNRDNPLLPICHTTQQAHIEVVISHDGEFLRAAVVPKDHSVTVIPCTERSESRSGTKPVNHPLCDKLQYLAGDFVQFGGVVTSGFAKNPREPYEMYLNDLTAWVNSPYSHPKAAAVLKYVQKGTLVQDLVNYGILHVNSDGELLDRWTDPSEPPEIFRVLNNQHQSDAFVRWVVEKPGALETAVWRDRDLIQAWIDYYFSLKSERDICYATGKEAAVAILHPAKIRNDGDKAKLISGDDTSGFTFRGRFETDAQAARVSFEVTQKAHNMLRWLVRTQGFQSGNLAIVAWAIGAQRVPNPVYDSISLLSTPDEPDIPYTAEEFAVKLRRRILGLQEELGEFTNINIIGLNSAEPGRGRIAISFYRELWGSEFLRRLESWHTNLAWHQGYSPHGFYGTTIREFIGAPSLFDIAEAAYGLKLDQKLKARTIERLLPCVIDGQALPTDVINAAVRRASNRVAFSEEWAWKKTLSIACALYKGANIREGYTVALDPNRRTRDYLYGRLLAYADSIERWALSERNEQRPTNAARLMQRFAERPYSTWRTLELSIRPYIDRLGAKGASRVDGISRVMDLFDPDDYMSDRPLSGEFLLGYHCQLRALFSTENQD